EVEEESGIKMITPKMKGIITFPMFDNKKDWYVFLFTTENFRGELVDSNEGKLEWIPNDELVNLNLWDGDKIFIPWLFEDKYFSAKFIYENGKYVSHEVNFY
ncbi:MAG: 7 8-dihydro-8-oxoguanine-triphosphatase, partial [Ignavibacteria bacterium]